MIRADAARNRAKILDAAEAVFAEHGITASTEEVARIAGVGIGTVFRHFPTKESLVEAVFAGIVQGFVDQARRLCDAEDPGRALFDFLEGMVEVSATKAAYADAVAAAEDALAEGRRELPRALDTLLTRAQQAGVVRRDVSMPELLALTAAVARTGEHAATSLRIVMDGLKV
ncbi:TetR/AcrR family transcriptional regulator [Nonomuraea sediminis]|uniref:TetR/AcrR family transcriptional regulator n=1 Tax=Nonomuraea sediminis TaxID=2835864 RepID=UPI001BDCC722|nr:helix-turn-helix domain-containing protein [Nonomuraea sediminis]